MRRSTLLTALLLVPTLVRAEEPPKPAPAPEPEAPMSAPPGEDGALRKIEEELARVMDELVSARARAAVLSQALFRTKLEVEVVRRADDTQLARIVLKLDGTPIHDSDGSALARDRAELFEGYVAPGMHELTIELTEQARENSAFGYVRSERYRIDIKPKLRTKVELIVRDDSDMAEEASEGDDGSYDVHTELRVSRHKVSD